MGAYSIFTNKCSYCEELFQTEHRNQESCSIECKGKLHSDKIKKDKVEIKCEICGEMFKVMPAYEDSRKFCSKNCVYESNRANKITKLCKRCGDEFEFKEFKDREFCSSKCSSLSNLPDNSNKVIKSCIFCEEEFKTTPSEDKVYCSNECYRKDEYNTIVKECQFCGDEFSCYDRSDRDRKFCSRRCSCNQRTEDSLKVLKCDNCGEEFEVQKAKERRFCDQQCYIEFRQDNLVIDVSGSNNSQWVDDDVPIRYGKFWSLAKKKVLRRDDFQCVVCGDGKSEIGKLPDVHHIKPRRAFDDLSNSNKVENLVCLCPKHHNLVEGWGLAPANVLD